MSRIADDQREGGRISRSDERLAERRAALRRAVSDLGDVTSRFRTRLAEAGHEVPPAPPRNGSHPPLADPAPIGIAPLPPRTAAEPAPSPTVPPRAEDGLGPVSSERNDAMAEARMRFESASRQADELVRTITEAVRSETRAFRANIEAGAETRFREVEIEAQRRMRRAQSEADALVEQRRRRIGELSDRILALGEMLAGRLAEADEVKGQFDVFVQALSQASDRLAREGAPLAEAPSGDDVGGLPARETSGPWSGLAEAA